MSAFYAMWHGPDGLQSIAKRVRSYTHSLRSTLATGGVKVSQNEVFDTFVVSQVNADELMMKAQVLNINLRKISAESVGIALDETVTEKDLHDIASLFDVQFILEKSDVPAQLRVTQNFLRTEFLIHFIRDSDASIYEDSCRSRFST